MGQLPANASVGQLVANASVWGSWWPTPHTGGQCQCVGQLVAEASEGKQQGTRLLAAVGLAGHWFKGPGGIKVTWFTVPGGIQGRRVRQRGLKKEVL